MLQGSLENFALDEVLGLLAGTSKTGQLEIAGNRGTGVLTFDDGRLIDGSASYTANGTGIEDVMFELLRYSDGTFSFSSREVGPGENPENVASVLASAEHRLRDWRSIEMMVPSLKHEVAPSPDLPADEVTITRAEWAALNVIGSGCAVSLVCDKLDLGEVEGSRQIKSLAERQLITVNEPIGGYLSASRAGSLSTMSPDATIAAPTAGDIVGAPTAPDSALAGSALGSDPLGSADTAAAAFETAADSSPGSVLGTAAGFDASAPVGIDSTGELTTQDRPPMPPIPVPSELAGDASSVPPEPPSPAEISSFGEGLEDASELVEEPEETKSGGLLARYLKGDD